MDLCVKLRREGEEDVFITKRATLQLYYVIRTLRQPSGDRESKRERKNFNLFNSRLICNALLKPFKFHYRTYSFTFSNIRSLVSSYRRERGKEEEEEEEGGGKGRCNHQGDSSDSHE